MIKSWEELGEALSDFENRLLLLEGLHASSNAHLLNNGNNVILQREDTKGEIDALENIIKFQDRIVKEMPALQKELHGLSEFLKTLSARVTLLEDSKSKALNTKRYNYK